MKFSETFMVECVIGFGDDDNMTVAIDREMSHMLGSSSICFLAIFQTKQSVVCFFLTICFFWYISVDLFQSKLNGIIDRTQSSLDQDQYFLFENTEKNIDSDMAASPPTEAPIIADGTWISATDFGMSSPIRAGKVWHNCWLVIPANPITLECTLCSHWLTNEPTDAIALPIRSRTGYTRYVGLWPTSGDGFSTSFGDTFVVCSNSGGLMGIGPSLLQALILLMLFSNSSVFTASFSFNVSSFDSVNTSLVA
mmetsp:Transcript_10646/g.25623  ORF Transcript_10646/g.25623 Transcript_10646/m.25623 type:complete len:252 (-) Transcript_10646:1203-1958(-)